MKKITIIIYIIIGISTCLFGQDKINNTLSGNVENPVKLTT